MAAPIYHDGRFATLADVVNHYDSHVGTRLSWNAGAFHRICIHRTQTKEQPWPAS